jgi:hypothetical protein
MLRRTEHPIATDLWIGFKKGGWRLALTVCSTDIFVIMHFVDSVDEQLPIANG